MWNLICNYISEKLFNKPSVGQKRKGYALKNDEYTEYPPYKLMKLDTKNSFKIDNSNKYINNMKKQEYTFQVEKEYEVTNDVVQKKWESSFMLGRQSIHDSKTSINSSAPLDKRKPISQKVTNSPKHSLNETNHVAGKLSKTKGVSNKISNPNRTNSRQSTDKSKSTFQTPIKRNLSFLQESYRLSEKAQYMQLLQQQTTKLNSLLTPLTMQKVGFQKIDKSSSSSIPVIDLTKSKNSIFVDKSRENIPRTSSWSKSSTLLPVETNIDSKEKFKINSLQEMLKTYKVTDATLVDDILSKHATETAKKQKQLEIETAKLKVLSESNRKSYAIALEEKLREYMRITTPIEPSKDKYELPTLNELQEKRISSILVGAPSGEVLVEKYGLQIKRRDLQTLKGLNWLNDEVINFYMNLIMERGKNDKLPSVYAFNTFFYPKLISGGHSSLKRWTKKVDIFSHDMILVPVHLGMHWCMSVIDFRSKEIRYYDSMGSSNNCCLQALLSYLKAESLDKKNVPFETTNWELINVDNIPQQMNGSDCGVFSCVFAEHLSRDSELLFSQDNMPYFRKKMALEIVEAKLLT
ncbi:sentrin/sumo-specific protease, putative [Pediculus humanus corporis]|uniref:Sentrin/sumo-specific protease, putative n=1 Tax=Pediculus humanus subsp. corporis TaxID=121224 RepID=E0W3V2_PEDHC|nr:sentrin/sumo-specific protease, putative [Pediculus humanus corporis]EEB20308.1 sentrin/sumo-specific protease, putative [Pediculus humanus corporis]